MSNYEEAFGTDWESLSEDEGMRRAYALGVATILEEFYPEELEAIRAEMDTAYSKSVVDLAFEEGRNEGRELMAMTDSDTPDETVWSRLIEEHRGAGDDSGGPTGGRLGLPEAIDRFEALERHEPDSTESLEFPDFLKKD